jgi:hypothetical protein
MKKVPDLSTTMTNNFFQGFPWKWLNRSSQVDRVEGQIQRWAASVTTFSEGSKSAAGPHTQYHIVVNYRSYKTDGNSINAAYLATAKVNDYVCLRVCRAKRGDKDRNGTICNVLSIEYRDPVSSVSLFDMVRFIKRLIALDYH